MPETPGNLAQCEDCGHHFQTTPSGEVQNAACPDCGGKRLFRMQPNPVQSEGTLRNLVDMETGKDAGGNPDAEGILAPPSGHSILTAFAGGTLCSHCNADLMGSDTCPRCGQPSGIPAELRSEIAGAPLTEGGIMQTEHTDPLDTGTHGRDEYAHSHVIASLFEDFEEEDQPHREREREVREMEDARARERNRVWQQQERLKEQVIDLPCPYCGKRTTHPTPDFQSLYCTSCDRVMNIPEDYQQQQLPGEVHHPDPWMDNEPGTLTIPEGHPALWHKSHDSNLDRPGKDVFPRVDPTMGCPRCGGAVDFDPHSEDAWCQDENCGWSNMIHRDEPWGNQHFVQNELENAHMHWPMIGDELMHGYVPVGGGPGAWKGIGPFQGRTADLLRMDEQGNIVGRESIDPETGVVTHYPPSRHLNWEPGMHGRGLIIGGEPHTWNGFDPNLVDEGLRGTVPSFHGPLHKQYVEELGVDPSHVDFNTGVEIRPTGEIEPHRGTDVSPFIAADPRLKELEGKFFAFGSSMPAQTNNMEPYESWEHVADVMFDKGPIQNVPPHSQAVQPSQAGIHGRHTGRHQTLAFLDAHINGIPVRTRGGEIANLNSPRGQDYGKPVIVAVHDPEHLAPAIEAIEHPLGWSQQMNDLARRIQSGEVAPPPGIEPTSLQPEPGVFPEVEHTGNVKTAFDFWNAAEMAGLGAAGLALAVPTGGADLPEVGAGEAALAAGDAGAGAAASDAGAGVGKTGGGLMSKALNAGGGLAKAEGITGLVNQGIGAGSGLLGIPQGGGGGQQAAPYNGPLQQFTHVLAAFVEADYETPSSVPDVGVKHDNPEDVDQKEFNDQDRSPENPLNPNLQDSGASGEDAVRDKSGKPTQDGGAPWHKDSPSIKRMEMLLPLIEKYYHSEESGANDPMLRELHEMLEAEYPGYLQHADPDAAERFFQLRRQPDHVHAKTAIYLEEMERRSPVERRRAEQELQEQFGQDRRTQMDRRSPAQLICPACKHGEIVGSACNNCGTTMNDILALPTSREGQTKEAIVPPMQQGGLQEAQNALDPTGLDPSLQPPPKMPNVAPSSQMPPGGTEIGETQHCTNCGAAKDPTGHCPNCGLTTGMSPSSLRGPESVPKQAAILAATPPMQQGNLQQQQEMLDPTGITGVHPNSQTPPGGAHQTGHCPTCGGALDANGGCPQCGSKSPMGQMPGQPFTGGPGGGPESIFSNILAALVEGANHQGPVTPEQIASVQQWLIQHGRTSEVPNVELDPGNPEYVKILKEIQGQPNVPPSVTPEEQTQPPPPPMAGQPGAMPVPGMAPGETGGQPMQPMSSVHEAMDPNLVDQFMQNQPGTETFPEEWTHEAGADNIAPRCPKCKSGTTGMTGDGEGHARCNACGNIWKTDAISDDNAQNLSLMSHREALHDDQANDQANPVGVPAAEQGEQTNQGGDQDSSLTWKDTSGAPLVAGQTYEMKNPSYSLPDLIRVERTKPDGIDVTLLGTYANDPTQEDPNRLTSSTPISKEDMELQELTFEPIAQDADEHNPEPPPGQQAPGLPPMRPTTDEQTAREPAMAHVIDDGSCPKCGRNEKTSAMITAEATEHECYRCLNTWVTEEKDPMSLQMVAGEWVNPSAEWLNEDEDAEDFSPRRMGMMEASQHSKNIHDIAEKDDRLRAVREHLLKEGEERQKRVAGRHFTPREQRELIDEDGNARNRDMLDLEGTHYKTRESWDSKANAERVRDSDLFLGI